VAACEQCGEPQASERARFCSFCGAPLAARVETRKTVSIVFCDLVGSTDLGGRLDPESVRALLARYFAAMREALERHGGTIEKFIGDAVMAVFGVPVVHEDDARRAVLAALDMRARLAALNGELEERWGVRLRHRIGVNTGEVVASDPAAGQGFVVGDAVNVAARLEQAAGAGEIVIGAETARRVDGAFSLEALPPLTVKGKPDPLAAWRVAGTIERRRRDLPFVGRRAERERLDAALARVVESGRCELLVITGAPGAGKSRLLDAWTSRCSARVLRARCLPYGATALAPIGELVRAAVGVRPGEDSAEVRRKLAAAVEGDGAGGLRLHEPLAVAAGIGSAQLDAAEVGAAVRVLLQRLAAGGPVVACVEDLHWAAPAVLDLIARLRERAGPVLIVGTARPELQADALAPELLALEPLGGDALIAHAANVLGGALAPEVQEAVRQAAAGNPLFAEEFVRSLAEDGRLEHVDGEWRIRGDLAGAPLPATIEAIVAARVDALEGLERRVVEAASVLGPTGAGDDLVELVDASAELVGASLRSLARRQLLEPASSGTWAFGHGVIRDVAYGLTPKRRRAELHEAFGDRLDRRAAGEAAEFAAVVGEHLERACLLLAELRPPTADDRALAERASARLVAAGDAAMRRGDPGEAAALGRRAADLLPPDAPQRAPALLMAGRGLGHAGTYPAALAAFAEAEACATLEHERWDARAGRLLSELVGGLASVEDLLRACDEAARFDLPAALHGHYARLRAQALAISERWGASAEYCREAAEICRAAGDRVTAALAIEDFCNAAILGPMPVSEALASLERIAPSADADWTASLRAVLHGARGGLLAMGGDHAAGEEHRRQAITICAEMNWVQLSVTLDLYWYLEADLTGAEAQRELQDALVRVPDEEWLPPTVAAMIASGLLDRGDAAAAQAAFDGVAAPAADDLDAVTRTDVVRARLLARAGEFDRADALARRALDRLAGRDGLNLIAHAHLGRADVLRLAGRDGGAEIRAARELYSRKGNVLGLRRTERLLGLG
jgi:class 3 adenylate cyclase/tetratricopeptide (TPR) repeat protein